MFKLNHSVYAKKSRSSHPGITIKKTQTNGLILHFKNFSKDIIHQTPLGN